ncbi:hypothetical protein ABZP36_029782 [Zizania latifolia]
MTTAALILPPNASLEVRAETMCCDIAGSLAQSDRWVAWRELEGGDTQLLYTQADVIILLSRVTSSYLYLPFSFWGLFGHISCGCACHKSLPVCSAILVKYEHSMFIAAALLFG